MTIRNRVAKEAPRLLAHLQAMGVLPSPWSEAQHPSLSQSRGNSRARVLGRYEAPPSLAGFVIAADDVRSQSYRHRFDQADHESGEGREYGVFEAKDVKIWPRFGVHASAAGSLIDTYCSRSVLANPKYELPRLALPALPVRARFAAGIFLGPAWYHNHYHWMLDILPRLQLVGPELNEGLPVVVPPDLRSAQLASLRASLDRLGRSDTEIVTLPHVISVVERLIMPTNITPPLEVAALQREFLRSVFLQIGKSSPKRRLYISRGDAAVRRLVNERELVGLLAARGFEQTELGSLPLTDQVRLFQEAEFVIGAHGSGMVNLAFCNPGTTVVEIFQEGHFASCFARLAQRGSLRYGYAVGAAAGSDISVDVASVVRLIDRLDG